MKKIILTNQHSDNRGDESATVGVIKSLRKHYGEDAQITIFLQSGNKFQFLPKEYRVNERSMITKPIQFLGLFFWVILKIINIDVKNILSKNIRSFIETHKEADIVISSCGGPYIGDIYINHEFIHLIHVFVPQLLKKKTAFFSPSMGPFNNKVMNVFRRRILNKTDIIVLRDPISFDYVKRFLQQKGNIYLTTDACLADEIDLPISGKKSNIIGITPIDYKYPLSNDVEKSKEKYETTIIETLNELMSNDLELKVEFFPQLYGKHSDLPFIETIISRLKYPERTIIFSDKLSGRDQQVEISKIKYMIASRYHSAIFACKTRTPVVCIVYEHKARAFMNSVNLGDYCLDIYNINKEKLLGKINLLNENYIFIENNLKLRIPEMTSLASKTAELVFEKTSD